MYIKHHQCITQLIHIVLSMDIILTSVKDLVKFKVVSTVNTGDKTYDNLLIGLATSLLVMIFSTTVWSKLYSYVVYNILCLNDLRSYQTAKYYKEQINKAEDLKYYPIRQPHDKFDVNLLEKIMKHIHTNCAFYYTPTTGHVTEKGYMFDNIYITGVNGVSAMSTFSYSSLSNCCNRLLVPRGDFVPIFAYRGGCVALKVSLGGELQMAYSGDKKVLDEFFVTIDYTQQRGVIEKPLESDKDKVKPALKSIRMKIGGQVLPFNIYENRTFSQIVSHHKSTVISYLDDFMEANKTGVSKFNGLGSYNLGIILHGAPGTGKTAMIKAICNYLGRNGECIDMRGIKTHDDFTNLFINQEVIKNTVYILDEFDCVQGVISRDNEPNNNSTNNAMEKLRERYIALLPFQANEDKTERGVSKELEEIKRAMTHLENQLTTDTMLTTLDGMAEMRGRVIVATTNYIDRIDKALLRGGRFDLKLKLEPFTEEECRDMLAMLFPEANHPYMNGRTLPNGVYTPVEIINACHIHRTYEGVVDALCKTQSSEPVETLVKH